MTSFLSTWVRSPRKGTLNIDWGRLLRTEQSIAVQLAGFDRWHRGIVELPCSSLKLSSPPGLLIGAQTANAGTRAEDMELKAPGPGRYPGAPGAPTFDASTCAHLHQRSRTLLHSCGQTSRRKGLLLSTLNSQPTFIFGAIFETSPFEPIVEEEGVGRPGCQDAHL